MTGTTFSEYLTWGSDVLRSAKVDEPRRDARLLLSHASGQPVEWITAHPEADFTAGPTYRRLIERRRTPFQAVKEGGDRCVRRGGETAAIPIECVAHRQGI